MTQRQPEYRFLLRCACIIALAAGMPALADERTVVLTISKMTKTECQVAVTDALKGVHGVSRVTAAYATKSAYVTFDDHVTDLDALKQATARAGFPVTDSTATKAR